MKKLIAYNNDPKLKARFIEEITKHEKADAIVRRIYGKGDGENWKGCAIGCSLKSMNTILGKDENTSLHIRYEDELGIPLILARLEDTFFEEMSIEKSKTWPRIFAEAIPVGADLSKVWPKLAKWMLADETDGVIRFANGRQDVIDTIKGVTNVLDMFLEDEPDMKEIESAAYSVARLSASSAWSAAEAAAWSAARSAAYDRMADKLVELLKSA